MMFLRDAIAAGVINKDLVKAWFLFPEIKQNWLGFPFMETEELDSAKTSQTRCGPTSQPSLPIIHIRAMEIAAKVLHTRRPVRLSEFEQRAQMIFSKSFKTSRMIAFGLIAVPHFSLAFARAS